MHSEGKASGGEVTPEGRLAAAERLIAAYEDRISRLKSALRMGMPAQMAIGEDVRLSVAMDSDRDTARVCGRLMVGSGTDTYDPLCELPAGHAGSCRSTAAVDQHRLVTPDQLELGGESPRHAFGLFPAVAAKAAADAVMAAARREFGDDLDPTDADLAQRLSEAARQAVLVIGDEAAGELSDPDARQLGPFARDSETSRQAALAAYPKQGTQRWTIIRYFARRPRAGRGFGATRNELAYALDLVESTVRPRVRELIEGGWIEETEHTRKTDTGCSATVLVLTEEGRQRIAREASAG